MGNRAYLHNQVGTCAFILPQSHFFTWNVICMSIKVEIASAISKPCQTSLRVAAMRYVYGNIVALAEAVDPLPILHRSLGAGHILNYTIHAMAAFIWGGYHDGQVESRYYGTPLTSHGRYDRS